MRAHLALDDLTARYGDAIAVDRLSLEIGRGEMVSLLGPSGCGKSTTLRMIAGLVVPSSGKITLGERDITRLPAHKRNIGVVFQSYALFPHLSALDNIGFGLRMRNLPAAVCRERAQGALELVGLKNYADRYPGQLSGGQQQRVALARALVIEPDVLLLDEPLSNLDAHLRADMRSEIRALQQRLAITTIFVTHDQQEALAISDRIMVMSKGVLVESGSPAGLCDHPKSQFTASFLGSRAVIPGTTADGIFTAPGLQCSGAPPGAIALVLRATRLRFSSAPGPLAVSGTVLASTFLGDTCQSDVSTAAGMIQVILPSDIPPPDVGAICALQAMPGGISFIQQT